MIVVLNKKEGKSKKFTLISHEYVYKKTFSNDFLQYLGIQLDQVF